MVASTHWLASQSAMAVLEHGGNAFDAAAAAGFVLQVVEPHLNGSAGEVPILGWDARDDAPFVVCGQGVAPRAATIERFHSLGLDLVPGTGLLAACIPGSFDGWLTLLERHGTMRLREVLGYAIGYAEGGFPVVPNISATIATVEQLFTEHWPTSARLWMPDGKPPAAGSMLRNPELAQTFRRILAEAEAVGADREAQLEAARRAYYQGFVAEAICRFARENAVMDVSGEPHTGLLTEDDFAGWRATVEEPVSLDYRDRTVLKADAWSQGPVLLQQLALLRGFDLDGLAPNDPDLVHLVTECAKLAFADREAWYGDPRVVDVPLRTLLSRKYNDARRALVGEYADTGPLRPGSPDGREPRLGRVSERLRGEVRQEARREAGAVGEPTVRTTGETAGDTCHVDVVDRWGNMVSATPSGSWLQSSPAIPGLGLQLSTRAQMFWLEEGLAASLAPGKRPRTTLTPSLALRDGRPWLAFGTPGGDGQDQWSLQLFLHLVHGGLNLQEAIDAPEWSSSHFPSSFYPRERFPGRLHVESRLGEATIAELRRRGHEVVDEGPWALGRLSAVSRDEDGVLRAGANPRGMQGYAVGR
ncbi:MAG TPA: gamma-glutamyltransferase family protein [Segeticoccus sp.]|uniref:gamma-glutamyltransferase family protein n=1 Tax=Segeticoccus sp. TaxID=2706531 RepID=UPI002D7FE0CF|nr:gamma-glutamyltransferase family protein [Segeticoccus sp.]HET8601711.1 gamma-glutamyltransferase family protein [Segeticoccus sp.]